MSLRFLLQAAPHANFVVGVVAGFIIATVVVLIVCLLLVVKYKHKKISSGEYVNYTAATAACFLFTVVVFFTAFVDNVCWFQPTTESRFVLSHMHVQIC